MPQGKRTEYQVHLSIFLFSAGTFPLKSWLILLAGERVMSVAKSHSAVSTAPPPWPQWEATYWIRRKTRVREGKHGGLRTNILSLSLREAGWGAWGPRHNSDGKVPLH